MRKTSLFMLPICLMLASQGCIIVDHEHPGCVGDACYEEPGEISFWWAFELYDGQTTDWCNVADVSRVDIVIYNSYGDPEFEALDRPCGDMGAIIDNFWPGTYEMQLVGICPTGYVTHEGWWEFEVYSGRNELGELVLDYLGDCP